MKIREGKYEFKLEWDRPVDAVRSRTGTRAFPSNAVVNMRLCTIVFLEERIR